MQFPVTNKRSFRRPFPAVWKVFLTDSSSICHNTTRVWYTPSLGREITRRTFSLICLLQPKAVPHPASQQSMKANETERNETYLDRKPEQKPTVRIRPYFFPFSPHHHPLHHPWIPITETPSSPRSPCQFILPSLSFPSLSARLVRTAFVSISPNLLSLRRFRACPPPSVTRPVS